MRNDACIQESMLEDFGKATPDFDLQIWVGDLKSLNKSYGKRRRHIYGEASNPTLDLEGDVVDASGVSQSMDFWKSHGKVDWCHKGAALPDYLVGEPVDWLQKGGRLMIEGELYDDWPMADKVHQLLQSGAKLGYSLGGKILKTAPVFDKDFGGMVKKVQKVFVNHVAVTPFPVNYNTNVTLVPWDRFVGMLDKSIIGKNSGAGDKELSQALNKTMSTVSGSALLTESLEHGGNRELKRTLQNIISMMKGGAPKPERYFNKSGQFHSPRHAHNYLVKCQGVKPTNADALVDYLVLRNFEIASIL
jgi:hypothetical protein